VITGLDDDEDAFTSAANALELEGAVLLDVPKRRGTETLHFYRETLHRDQREEFIEFPSLSVSEVWKLLYERLHETAGNIRVFLHPDIDVLRRARDATTGERVMPAWMIEEELRGLFGLQLLG
jgi:hypothetical protein